MTNTSNTKDNIESGINHFILGVSFLIWSIFCIVIVGNSFSAIIFLFILIIMLPPIGAYFVIEGVVSILKAIRDGE